MEISRTKINSEPIFIINKNMFIAPHLIYSHSLANASCNELLQIKYVQFIYLSCLERKKILKLVLQYSI